MNSLCHKREGGEGRGGGGEGRGGREEGGDGGREGRDDYYTYYSDGTIHLYIQTNNEELYLYNNDVTYYVITCKSAFEYNNDITYYVITCKSAMVRNYQWTPE